MIHQKKKKRGRARGRAEGYERVLGALAIDIHVLTCLGIDQIREWVDLRGNGKKYWPTREYQEVGLPRNSPMWEFLLRHDIIAASVN